MRINEKKCTGCSACALVCSKKAITIEMDKEGFFAASVDEKLCNNCGLCTKVCINFCIDQSHKLQDGLLFSAQSKNKEVLKSSSSGGIAYELSLFAIEKGFAVVGVIYDNKTNTAKTVLVNNKSDLEKLKGSKYLQSYTFNAFRQLLDEARKNENKQFLVFGTPCQIFGLRKLLDIYHLNEQFILVDLFCHGVPSYKVWFKYLDNVKAETGSMIENVVFRNKDYGWHDFVITIKGNSGNYIKHSSKDLFYDIFFDNVLLMRTCFDCKVRMNESKADMRLGDFWGKRYLKNNDGVSAVLVFSEKGKMFLEANQNINIIEQISLSEMLSSQSAAEYDTFPLREKAFKFLDSSNDLKATIKCYRKEFDIKKRIVLFIKKVTSVKIIKLYKMIKK